MRGNSRGKLHGRFRRIFFFAQVCAGRSFQLPVEVRGEVGTEVDVAIYGKVCLADCVELCVKASAGYSDRSWQSKEWANSP